MWGRGVKPDGDAGGGDDDDDGSAAAAMVWSALLLAVSVEGQSEEARLTCPCAAGTRPGGHRAHERGRRGKWQADRYLRHPPHPSPLLAHRRLRMSSDKYTKICPGGGLILAWQLKGKKVLLVGGGNVAAGACMPAASPGPAC